MKVYLASEISQQGGCASVSSMSLSHWAKDKPRSMHKSGTMLPTAFIRIAAITSADLRFEDAEV
jgi:hypothetical protein